MKRGALKQLKQNGREALKEDEPNEWRVSGCRFVWRIPASEILWRDGATVGMSRFRFKATASESLNPKNTISLKPSPEEPTADFRAF